MREREERETRYVLRAMLRDQGRGLGWEVRDVWGVRGQGGSSHSDSLVGMEHSY